jgi:hypothetical protein
LAGRQCKKNRITAAPPATRPNARNAQLFSARASAQGAGQLNTQQLYMIEDQKEVAHTKNKL